MDRTKTPFLQRRKQQEEEAVTKKKSNNIKTMHSPERQNAESPATGAHTDGTFGIYELRWQVIYTKKCLYTAQVVAVAVVPKNGHRATISLAHILMGCTLLVRFIHSLKLRCFEYSSRIYKCEYNTIENSLILVLIIVSAV